MNAQELSALSDQQLSERVAVEVAGFQTGWSGTGMSMKHDGYRVLVGDEWKFYYFHQLPPFATSADAVLPLLEKYPFIGIDRVKGDGWQVAILSVVEQPGGGTVEGVVAESWQDTIAKAACIALLLAKGAA